MRSPTNPLGPDEQAQAEDDGWVRVVYAADCADDGLCPVCKDIEFSECPCPGPTMEELYEYRFVSDRLYARLKPEAERG